jgi:hypothetical protein
MSDKIKSTATKIGGIATGIATVVLAIVTSWNSLKNFFTEDNNPTIPVDSQSIELVQKQDEVSQQQPLEKVGEQSVIKNNVQQNKTTSAKETETTTKSKTEQSVKVASQTSSDQNSKQNTTEAKGNKDVRIENVSFVSRGAFSKNIDVNCSIVNNSSSVSYSGIVLKVEYYDASNNLLTTRNISTNEVIVTNKNKSISVLGDKVDGTEKIKVKCVKATAGR